MAIVLSAAVAWEVIVVAVGAHIVNHANLGFFSRDGSDE
jgi:hypothetical protein